MLTPKKKLTKREIREDAVMSTFTRASMFYYENRKYISYGITAVVVLAILGYVYFRNKETKNETAATELGKVYTIYDGAMENPSQFPAAIDGQPERGIMGLKSIVENYGNTEAGEYASFYLANAYFYTGKIDEALALFEDFDCDDSFLNASAVAGEAACYEVKRDFKEAGSLFEKAASMVGDQAVTPEYLSAAGRNYAEAGEKEKALALFKRVKKEFPTSTFAREADRYISQLSA